MKTKLLLPLTLLLVLAAGLTVLVGCKQGAGERCQVSADCDNGLVCNQGTNPPTCQSAESNLPIDATVPDIADAPVDMPVDAVDAMPDA